jgi:hypothetical protein
MEDFHRRPVTGFLRHPIHGGDGFELPLNQRRLRLSLIVFGRQGVNTLT